MKISERMLNIVRIANNKFARNHINGGINIGVGYGLDDDGNNSWVVVLRRLPQTELDRGERPTTGNIKRLEFEMSFRTFHQTLAGGLKSLEKRVKFAETWEDGQF